MEVQKDMVRIIKEMLKTILSYHTYNWLY